MFDPLNANELVLPAPFSEEDGASGADRSKIGQSCTLKMSQTLSCSALYAGIGLKVRIYELHRRGAINITIPALYANLMKFTSLMKADYPAFY